MNFWEFDGNTPSGKPLRWIMLEAALQGKWGRVIGEMDGTFGSIFTLDLETAFPRYVIAKIPKIEKQADPEKIRKKIILFLHEINETYKYIHYPGISRHF